MTSIFVMATECIIKSQTHALTSNKLLCYYTGFLLVETVCDRDVYAIMHIIFIVSISYQLLCLLSMLNQVYVIMAVANTIFIFNSNLAK